MSAKVRHGKGRTAGALVQDPSAWVSPSADIDISCDVTIEADAIVSDEVLILTHDHIHEGKRVMVFSPLVIGRGVFIGARAIILEGCSFIGQGAIIGAGAVVAKDIPAGEVWAGNPARRVR